MPHTYNLDLFMLLIVVVNSITRKISKKIKGIHRIGPHNKDIMSIIFGSLLGDGHAEKRVFGVGTRISFFQEDTHLKYIMHLHNILSKAGYCNDKIPTIKERLGIKGKVRKIARFHTWTYTSFNWIRYIWYINGTKCLPENINEYLTPLALAIWIMDDGTKIEKGLKLSTNNFTYDECNRLVSILYVNFELKASVQKAGADNQYIIYIWKQSMNDLVKIVSPYTIPEMKYKII